MWMDKYINICNQREYVAWWTQRAGISLFPSRTLMCESDMCMGMQDKYSEVRAIHACCAFKCPLGFRAQWCCVSRRKSPQAFKWISSLVNQAPSWSHLRVLYTNGCQWKLTRTWLPFGLLKHVLHSEVPFFVVYSVFF